MADTIVLFVYDDNRNIIVTLGKNQGRSNRPWVVAATDEVMLGWRWVDAVGRDGWLLSGPPRYLKLVTDPLHRDDLTDEYQTI